MYAIKQNLSINTVTVGSISFCKRCIRFPYRSMSGTTNRRSQVGQFRIVEKDTSSFLHCMVVVFGEVNAHTLGNRLRAYVDTPQTVTRSEKVKRAEKSSSSSNTRC